MTTIEAAMDRLFTRQASRARDADGCLDAEKLRSLVTASYVDMERDRRRTDRAMGLMAEELERSNAALEKLVVVPTAAQLWYDTTDIAALREGENERAQTAQVNATAIQTLIAAGYTPDSVTRAIVAGDLTLLQHTGLVSVQLQQPGAQPPVATPEVAP